eukprot:GCRY01003353.1.p1 GENE.GCRY01003353.1~~GCRY01003353.1.p1  ORF type:complete len:128 (+),score=0.76 GCRY01003353.1:163-546(+)
MAQATKKVFKALWESEVGVKTIHFWAPMMKWGMAIAGFSDLTRPVDKLSISQSCSLMATGGVWTRFCFTIQPRNWSLIACNVFLCAAGSSQVFRKLKYDWDTKKHSLVQAGPKAEIIDSNNQPVKQS